VLGFLKLRAYRVMWDGEAGCGAGEGLVVE
jgi:hypothetical protein